MGSMIRFAMLALCALALSSCSSSSSGGGGGGGGDFTCEDSSIGMVAFEVFGDAGTTTGRFSTSADGTCWKEHSDEIILEEIGFSARAGVYDGANFVLVGEDEDTAFAAVIYATDLDTWSNVQLLADDEILYDVVANNSDLLAVGSDETFTASDPSDWTLATHETNPTSGNAVAFDDTGTNAVKLANGIASMSSDSGATWTDATTEPALDGGAVAIAFGEGRFVAVGDNSGNATVAYSTDDGDTWTAGIAPVNGAFTSIAFGNDVFVATTNLSSEDIGEIYFSTAGHSWTLANVPSSDNNLSPRQVRYSATHGRFVLTNFSDSDEEYYLYSTDGENWSFADIEDGTRAMNNLFVVEE